MTHDNLENNGVIRLVPISFPRMKGHSVIDKTVTHMTTIKSVSENGDVTLADDTVVKVDELFEFVLEVKTIADGLSGKTEKRMLPILDSQWSTILDKMASGMRFYFAERLGCSEGEDCKQVKDPNTKKCDGDIITRAFIIFNQEITEPIAIEANQVALVKKELAFDFGIGNEIIVLNQKSTIVKVFGDSIRIKDFIMKPTGSYPDDTYPKSMCYQYSATIGDTKILACIVE